MDGEYHDESYNEQMEAQHGPYDNNEPPMLFPSDVDLALRRLEKALPKYFLDSGPFTVIAVLGLFVEERRRLGLPVGMEA